MVLLVGDNSTGSYTLTDDIYSANDEFFRSFTAVASASVDTLHLYVADMWTASNYKITLRDASGNLLAVGSTTGTGSKSVDVSGQSATVTSGNTYILGFIPDSGYLKPYNDDVNNVVRNDSASTYAAPADPVNTSAPTQAKGQFAIWAEGVSGPTIIGITNPVIGSLSVTLSEAAPTIDTIELTVGSRTEIQSYSTGDNTTFTIASVSRATLPPIAASATVTLKAGATEIASTTVELDPRTGYSAWVASGIDFTESGLAYNHTGDVPVDGDIAEISDHPNTTLGGTESASPWTVAQTISRSFEARIWQASTETWGATAVIPYDALRRKLYATALEATGLSATALSATSL